MHDDYNPVKEVVRRVSRKLEHETWFTTIPPNLYPTEYQIFALGMNEMCATLEGWMRTWNEKRANI